MKIKNKEELENWLFERVQVQGHICDGVKGDVNGEMLNENGYLINVAYTDRNTGETIRIEYE